MSIRPRPQRSVSHDAVLHAAARLFRQKGFGGTSVREIAREASMLPGSLHYRYATKEALLVALMEHAVEQGVDVIRRAVAGSSDPSERLRLALRAHLKLLHSADDEIYALLYEWRMLEGDALETVLRLWGRYQALWDGLLYELAGAGRLVEGVDLTLARLLILGGANWSTQWFERESRWTPEELADAFLAMIECGISSPDKRPPDPAALFRERGAAEPPRGDAMMKDRQLTSGATASEALSPGWFGEEGDQ